MKRVKYATLLLLMNATTTLAESNTDFSAAQKEKIGQIAAQYLVNHPEFLVQAGQMLQEKQMQQQTNLQKMAVLKNIDKVLNDSKTPYIGHSDAPLTVIEFFDYQCIFCSKIAPVIGDLQKTHPNIRFGFKETPIFGSRWEASSYAAKVGVSTFTQKGGATYQKYHNAIFDSGLNEGHLTQEFVTKTATSLGVDMTKIDNDYYKNNLDLFTDLGFKGTPAFIVMPTKGATIDNISVINGADIDALNKAINQK